MVSAEERDAMVMTSRIERYLQSRWDQPEQAIVLNPCALRLMPTAR